MKTIYLDNNATTQVDPEVIEAMEPYFHDHWGNPSSMHSFGGRVSKHVERARETIAAAFNAHPDEIVFTACGTESDNAAIRGVVDAFMGQHARAHIVTTAVEHPAVRSLCRYLQRMGCALTEVRVNSKGNLDLDQLKHSLQSDTAIASVMWANNETGVIFPMDEVAQIVKAAGKVLHTDAVQAAGKVPIDLGRTAVDLLSISGHKLHAPKGIGVLYIRRGLKINPYMVGGHQEGGRRAGTLNVPYIIGLAKAVELAQAHMREEQTRVAALRDRLEKGLLAACTDCAVNGDTQNRLPNTSNIGFKYIEGESILLLLDRAGICASSGSACTSGSTEPSHAMLALGVDPMALHGNIRFSLSRYNTEEEIDFAVAQVPKVVERLRTLSPYGHG